uniref:carboxylesterase n=1 Tax=Culicoides sonorensis TaxID=179676 RepID=A0A336MR08_CULSO
MYTNHSELKDILNLVWGDIIKNDGGAFRLWCQGFEFSEDEPAALRQRCGGPCGVLAPVQAYILKMLLSEAMGQNFKDLTFEKCKAVLVQALCCILTKCKTTNYYVVTLKDNSNEDTDAGQSSSIAPTNPVVEENAKTFHERLQIIEMKDIEHVRQLYLDNFNTLENQYGVLLFLYTVLLTKGMQNILSEICDTSEPLIHAVYGHASQPLINLMLTGRIVPYVWDGDKNIGGLALRGVNQQSDIGFLTIMEQMQYCTVGNFFKNPRCPVWVLASETHLTVLFSPENKLVAPETPREQAIRVFQQFNNDGASFIESGHLQEVLKQLGLVSVPEYVDIMRKKLDPESLGIILQNAFLEEFFEEEVSKCPDIFDLYHYNGIPNSNLHNQFQFSSSLINFKMNSNCVVNLKQGKLIGNVGALPNGLEYYYFKGIPYAMPPKRFEEALPINVFNEQPLLCNTERSIAYQKDMFSSEIIGSEDCLFLNIYTPHIGRKKLPVMFWIHGGAFNAGSGNSDLYSPEYLVQKEVVVVTINYRLGPLGFLHFPSMGIHGNYGLKDQLQALKFISESIENFGGDKNNITLFGESAGGVSVHFHFLSEESRKYFHKAICQSGIALNDWALQEGPIEKARKLSKLLGAKDIDDKSVYETLINARAEDLIRKANHTVTADEKRRSFIMPFRPVVESLHKDAFIKDHPLKLLKKKNIYSGIPIITGITDMEGIIMLKDCFSKVKNFNTDFCKYIPSSLNLTLDTIDAIDTGKKIKEFYFGSKPFDKNTEREMSEFMTDFHFSIGHYINSEIFSEYQQKTKHFLYQFSFDGELNMYKKFFSKTLVRGACHADDLFYLFKMTMAVPVGDNSEEAKMRSVMCELWTNFAKYGNPTPKTSNFDFIWEPVENRTSDLPCLDINKLCKMVRNPCKNRLEFWKSLYADWNKNLLKAKL